MEKHARLLLVDANVLLDYLKSDFSVFLTATPLHRNYCQPALVSKTANIELAHTAR